MVRIRKESVRERTRGDGTSPLGKVLSAFAGAFAVSTLLLVQDAQVHYGFVYDHRKAQDLNEYAQRTQPLPFAPKDAPTVDKVSIASNTACTKIPALQIQPRDHPHAGARDACGNYGYKHDPRAVFQHLNPAKVDYKEICRTPLGKGSEGEGGGQALQKIQIANVEESDANSLRLLCVVYSVDSPHHEEMVKAGFLTWGHNCDGFLVASNVTKASIGAVDIPHLGPEEYGCVWQKIRSTWSYIHDNYLDDYDFVYIAGEDTYVIVENLRQIIHQAHGGNLYKDPNWIPTDFREVEQWEDYHSQTGKERPLYLGALFPFTKNRYVCAGGAGYVLNRPAIQRLIQNFPYTQPDKLSPKEDFFVAAALRNQSVACSDTRDSTGAWRFHHLDAQFQYNYKNHQRPAPWKSRNGVLERTRGIQEQLSLDGVSANSVSFHLTGFKKTVASPERLYRYNAILYGNCDNNQQGITKKK